MIFGKIQCHQKRQLGLQNKRSIVFKKEINLRTDFIFTIGGLGRKFVGYCIARGTKKIYLI